MTDPARIDLFSTPTVLHDHLRAKPPVMALPKREEPAAPNNPAQRDLRAEAAAWIQAHPQDAGRFMHYAREMLLHGAGRISIKAIGERVRWDLAKERSRTRIDNNHLSYIARWMIAEEPALEKLIHFRETRW
jgi:hypothetical protein